MKRLIVALGLLMLPALAHAQTMGAAQGFAASVGSSGGGGVPPTGCSIAAGVLTCTGFVGALTGNVTGDVVGNLTGAVTGNADTATALAANPADCSSNQFANAIAANGDLSCAALTLSGAQFENQGTTTTVLHGNAAGNPSFAAITLTTDVTGVLPVANGGTNLNAAADNEIPLGNGTTWQSKAIPDCPDTGGNHLNYDASTNTFSCGTS